MNFGVNVSRVRATADVYFKKKKLGCLNLRQWQQATSTRMADSSIMVESNIKDAPLYITDDAVFQDVVGDLLFGGKAVMLKIDALVDLAVETVLGELIVRDVPGYAFLQSPS
jgi:ribosome-interacting GTPase 1